MGGGVRVQSDGGGDPEPRALVAALRGPAQVDQVRVRRAAPERSLLQRAMTPAPWEQRLTEAIVRLLRGGG